MIRIAFILGVFLVPPQEASEKTKRDFVDKNVDKAIEKGLRVIREAQDPTGSFRTSHPHGVTALSLYTLLAMGGTLDDPAAGKALDWLLSNPINLTDGGATTYQVSLVAVALSYCIPHLPEGEQRDQTTSMLQRAADWLVSAQEPGGGWGYGQKSNGWHDHSNSQFAVLGLRAAANAGARVKKEVWEREYTHYKTSQQLDGGWDYRSCYPRPRRGGTTSTMTAAGVMGLAMTIGSLRAVRTEQMSSDPAIKKGLEAMKVHWNLGLQNNLKSLGGVPYLLYSIERACMLTGQKRLGSVDWYVEGAWLLINEQTPEGNLQFKNAPGDVPLASHCFCLLFLKRAFVPVATPSNPKPRPAAASDPTGGKPREME